METLVPQILMCFLADFAVSKSQRDCTVGQEVVPVNQVAFASTFQKVKEWHDFRGSLERDPDLCKLIDRCEKPLTPLKYTKLLYDFRNACHPDDWEYNSNCFMNSLKGNDEFQDFYTKFKQMYEKVCDFD